MKSPCDLAQPGMHDRHGSISLKMSDVERTLPVRWPMALRITAFLITSGLLVSSCCWVLKNTVVSGSALQVADNNEQMIQSTDGCGWGMRHECMKYSRRKQIRGAWQVGDKALKHPFIFILGLFFLCS